MQRSVKQESHDFSRGSVNSPGFRLGLVEYLNVILERKGRECFKSITFKNTKLPSVGRGNKASVLDFFIEATVETKAREYTDLEIQVLYDSDSSLPNRILYYGAPLLITSAIKKGGDYQNLSKNIVLCIQRKPITAILKILKPKKKVVLKKD